MQPLHIIVCLKPVPDPRCWKEMALDDVSKTIQRQRIPHIINPLDNHALETALTLKEQYGGQITVLSMAPPWAKDILLETLAKGADQAILLADARFAGADTLATSYALATAVRQLTPFDLILCGAASIDGSTAQVGPQLATLLKIPFATQVINVSVLENTRFKVTTETDTGEIVLAIKCPLLLTVSAQLNKPRPISLMGILSSRTKPITVLKATDLKIDLHRIGLKGSPTQTRDVFRPSRQRQTEVFSGSPQAAALNILEHLKAGGFLEN